MKKTLFTSLVAAAALAVPAAASAHDGWHHHQGWFHQRALYASLSGTGTLASAKGTLTSGVLGTGTFTSTVAATGAATTRTSDRGTLSCAPATATLTLAGTATATPTLIGRSCTWTTAGSTTVSGSMFWGRNSDTKAFVVAKPDGTVKGAVFKGYDLGLMRSFAVHEHVASSAAGGCDHDR